MKAKIVKDHDNYDYLSVSMKDEYAERIMACYRSLGWSDVLTEEDKYYSDMKYVLFTRPHRVVGKDRLQYVQVRMESALNRISERWVKKHRKSTALAVTMGLFGGLLIAAGVCLIALFSPVAAHVCGAVLAALGVGCWSGLVYPLVKVKKREDEATTESQKRDYELLERLTEEAWSITGAPAEFAQLSSRTEDGGDA